jgi:hypothetical protein
MEYDIAESTTGMSYFSLQYLAKEKKIIHSIQLKKNNHEYK